MVIFSSNTSYFSLYNYGLGHPTLCVNLSDSSGLDHTLGSTVIAVFSKRGAAWCGIAYDAVRARTARARARRRNRYHDRLVSVGGGCSCCRRGGVGSSDSSSSSSRSNPGWSACTNAVVRLWLDAVGDVAMFDEPLGHAPSAAAAAPYQRRK